MDNAPPARADETNAPPVQVRFARSGFDAEWRSGSLFRLARENGIRPRYGCRTGGCGECSVAILAGGVRYLRPPAAECADGHVILCMAWPDADAELPLVLDL
jgi:ferredoxin